MVLSKDIFSLATEYLLLPNKTNDTKIQAEGLTKECCNSYELTFTNLSSNPIPGSAFVLVEVSGFVKPGEILAVMGPTGCGKTSLLNAISGRPSVRLETGSIRLNGETMTKNHIRSQIGYTTQNDVFFPELTLKQTLVYTALLRLPDKKFTKAEKLEKVEEIIDRLGLRRCENTIIGDAMKRGLSGGEKKRLSIACELITNPSVLLIDEPTSGLDSCTASELMYMLKEYAQKESKSVILAVHQPSSEIFHLFDRLLLLSNGQTAYFGQSSDIVSHFAELELHISPNYNPADFIIEQLKKENTKILTAWENEVRSFQLQITSALTDNESSDFNGNEMVTSGNGRDSPSSSISSTSSSNKWPTSMLTQVTVLAARNFREARPRMLSKLNWLQTIILAIMAGLTWFKTERKEETLTDLEGWMFFSTTYWMLFSLFGALTAFPGERAVVEKERLSGSYRLSAYYVAKMLGEMPIVMVLPSVYLIVSYPLLGGSVISFFGILMVQILSSLAAQSAGLFFGAALNLQASITAAALFTLAAQLLGGYLNNNIPPFLKTFSLVYHAFRNMQLLEYSIGERVLCGNLTSNFESCNEGLLYVPPEELLNRDKLDVPYWSHTIFLIAFFIFFRILGYIALRRSL